MPLPVRYRNGSDSQRINFTFSEVATGTGLVTFDCFQSTSSGSIITDHLTSNTSAFSSNPASVTVAITGASYSNGDTFLFDAPPVIYPITIRGEAIADITQIANSTAGNSATQYLVLRVSVVRADGTIEELGQKTTEEIVKNGAGQSVSTGSYIISLTETPLKRGDKLRCTINIWNKGSAGSTGIPTNPLNTNTSVGTGTITASTNHTYTRFSIPFKVDL